MDRKLGLGLSVSSAHVGRGISRPSIFRCEYDFESIEPSRATLTPAVALANHLGSDCRNCVNNLTEECLVLSQLAKKAAEGSSMAHDWTQRPCCLGLL